MEFLILAVIGFLFVKGGSAPPDGEISGVEDPETGEVVNDGSDEQNDNAIGVPLALDPVWWKSDTGAELGINNFPTSEAMDKLATLKRVVEDVFGAYEYTITDAYRSRALSDALKAKGYPVAKGGYGASMHDTGEGVDLVFKNLTSQEASDIAYQDPRFTEILTYGPNDRHLHVGIRPRRK